MTDVDELLTVVTDELGGDIASVRPVGKKLYLTGFELAAFLVSGILVLFANSFLKGFGSEPGKRAAGVTADAIGAKAKGLRERMKATDLEDVEEIREVTELLIAEVRPVLELRPSTPSDAAQAKAVIDEASVEIAEYLVEWNFPREKAVNHGAKIAENLASEILDPRE